MSSDQLDFVTYCIGNLSIRLQLPQKAIYVRLRSTDLLYMFPIISGLRITTKYGQDFSLSPRANLAISTKFAYLYIDKSKFPS